jgi:hypothetical protein
MDELLPAGAFDKTYTILPTGISEDTEYGYTLNVETRSFGKMSSENLINKIEFYELNVAKTDPKAISNDLQIASVKKYGTWGYRVGTIESGILELGQGYDKGWVGFEIIDKRLKILEHTKVSSWANGWIVPSLISNQDSTIYIFYWPQSLEWGGLLVGAIALLVLVLKRR